MKSKARELESKEEKIEAKEQERKKREEEVKTREKSLKTREEVSMGEKIAFTLNFLIIFALAVALVRALWRIGGAVVGGWVAGLAKPWEIVNGNSPHWDRIQGPR